MGNYTRIIYDYNIASAAFCAVIATAVYVPIRAGWLRARRGARAPMPAEFARALLAGYAAALVNIVWFPVPETAELLFSDPAALAEKFWGGCYSWNSEILRCVFAEHDPFVLLRDFELLANTALFVPLGFLLPVAFRRLNKRQTALICLGTTVLVELVQPIFGRVGEPDDVITNFLGGVTGCLAAAVITRKRRLVYETKSG